jgi:hypothetical protein
VAIELVYGIFEFTLVLLFELPWVTQCFEVTGWYVVCTALLWMCVSMMTPPGDDTEQPGYLEIVAI